MNARAKICYGVMFAAALVLAVTGIGAFAAGKAPMTHWVLMAHCAVAPLFALALAAVALTWSGRCGHGANSPLRASAKVLLWVILLAGVVVLLTGVLPMTPLFGANGQHILYLTHRGGGIVLAGALLLHLPALRPRA